MTTNRNRVEKFTPSEGPKEAMLYVREKHAAVTCNLCAHRCYVPAGLDGVCKVRENRAGVLYTLVYDRVIAANIDRVEKKPLFHFLPGSETFSIATPGRNFHCRYCQNWEISQLPRIREGIVAGEKLTPRQIVRERHKSEFLDHIAKAFRDDDRVDPEKVTRAVLKVLACHISTGESDNVKHLLPKSLQKL